MGFSLNWASMQFYFVGDNLLHIPVKLLKGEEPEAIAKETRFVNLRIGLNYVFGREKVQEKQPTPY